MRVKATKKGFYLCERHPGDVFDLPDELLKKDKDGKAQPPTWAGRHEAKGPPTIPSAVKPGDAGAPAGPNTLSGVNKANTSGLT